MVRTRTTRTQSVGTSSSGRRRIVQIFTHSFEKSQLRRPSCDALLMNLMLWTCRRRNRECVYWICEHDLRARARALALTVRAQSIRLGACTDRLEFQFTILSINNSESIHQNDKIPQKIISSEFRWDRHVIWTWFWFTASSSSAFHIHFVDKMKLIQRIMMASIVTRPLVSCHRQTAIAM